MHPFQTSVAVRLLLAGLLSFLLVSCAGYRMGSVKPEIMSGVNKIAIPNFKNDTLRARISPLITNHVIQQFQRDGTYELGRTSDSDAVLYGTITEVKRSPFRLSRTNFLTSAQLRYRLSIEWQVEDRATGEILGGGTAFGESHSIAENNLVLSEREAISRAASRAGLKIMTQVSEGW